MCKDGKKCFIHWANIKNKDCCFNSAEAGFKKCQKCNMKLPKDNREFQNWWDIKEKEQA